MELSESKNEKGLTLEELWRRDKGGLVYEIPSATGKIKDPLITLNLDTLENIYADNEKGIKKRIDENKKNDIRYIITRKFFEEGNGRVLSRENVIFLIDNFADFIYRKNFQLF
jgi:hypothetical protein